jgi:hypothetical protein
MAAQRWTATCFVNSEVGTIDVEVYAATLPGARQQIRAKYGEVQQIVNLNAQGPARSSGSSGTATGGGGCATLFWLVVGIIAIGVFGGEDALKEGSNDSEQSYNAPVERVAPAAPEPQWEDYATPPPSYCVTENFEPC